ncbi:phosphatidylserine decarboxylase-domain-containing protein [Lentinula aff. detonsa]|uniref:Phosphatidylserine decarboxylase proenzyme 2 n=1 Tax=Lentinula aff. detonsa TaxID=2804958 RepID=A0AA38KM00_9AGAR|nr:phosphatidylserine decarboxylase-domain-containing protein [Lentinula aff. detonsa]
MGRSRSLKKGLRVGRLSLGNGKGSGRNMQSPIEGESPLVLLRVQVVACTDLLAKDRNGFSDPFATISLPPHPTRHSTPVSKRTLNPLFPAAQSTFDFPIYLSLADRLGVLEIVIWDKDYFGVEKIGMGRKEYLGEVGISLEDWFSMREPGDQVRALGWHEQGNIPFSISLASTRSNTHARGTVQLKIGFVEDERDPDVGVDFEEVYSELLKRSRPSLVNIPPTEGVGTVRSHATAPALPEDNSNYIDLSESDSSSFYSNSDAEISEEDEEGSQSETSESEGDAEEFEGDDVRTPTLTPIITSEPSPMTTPTASNTGAYASGTSRTPEPPMSFSALYTPPPASAPAVSQSESFQPSSSPASWSGVRVPTRPRRSSMDSPVSSDSIPPLSGVTISPGSTSPSQYGSEAVEPTVNQDAATQAAMGKKMKKPGQVSKEKEKKEKKKKKKKKESTKVKKEKAASAGEKTKVRPSKRKGEGKQRRKRPSYSFGGGESNDIVGIVMLEIQKAEDLPKLKNMTRTGWDMDPFVVISFGKKVFRTRVIRHSLNPSFDEKLLFHVRRYETNFKVHLTILDWDKLSSNDYIGECDFDVSELIAAFEGGRGVDPETGLYPLEDGKGDSASGMKDFKLPLRTAKEMPWEAKHRPFISLRGKYQPYAALRQRFWLQYLEQYDTDDTGMLSHLELTSMLDSLGSTLTNATIKSFFTRFNKDPYQGELTMAETIQCLETELGRPESQKKRLGGAEDAGYESSVSATPVMMLADRRGQELSLNKLDFSGPPLSAMISPGLPDAEFLEPNRVPAPMVYTKDTGAQQPLERAAAGRERTETTTSSTPSRPVASSSPTPPLSTTAQLPSNSVTFAFAPPPPSSISFSHSQSSSVNNNIPSTPSAATNPSLESPVERVINVKTCPLCHRPRLNAKAEVDIVTHLAICASQDWNKVDRIMVGNFVTASQAQRKWYTRILGKMSSGNYRLGANSANIIVQNRLTGQLEEEKMQVYVRLGIRLLYKGMKSRMEGSRARSLLKSLSIKQGVKYDSPESVRDIPPFIEFHKLDMNEVRDPVKSFKTFNQFFYRKLKPDARPVDSPLDPYRLVSAADCRFMAFESVSEATKLWIKGREFSVGRLLGNAYKAEAERYNGGALAIFRLAPQDYHRFHSPVDGKIGKMTYIAGEYYTVNPQAIRTALDVYGENARKIVPIDSPQFGRVMAVCVGAMMVGTIQTTVEEGQWVQRGEEFGYFAFGGSTIVLLFEPGVLEWDEDLLINGRAALETLVRVGMGLGTGLRKSSS